MALSRGIGGIQQLCVELATIIHANWHVAASVYADRKRLHLYSDFAAHHDETLKARAIEVAVNFRILDERLEASPAYRKLKSEVEAEEPGRFLTPTKQPLTLRECCNKIVHAKDFRFILARYDTVDPATGETFSNTCEDSAVKLSGTQGGRPWECEIDLLRFAEEVHQVISRWVYDEFEHM